MVSVILFHLIIKYDFINFDLSVSSVPLCIYWIVKCDFHLIFCNLFKK